MSEFQHALPNGYRLERYEIVRVLGVGGFGITYLAYDDETESPVAIKEFLPTEFATRPGPDQVRPLSASVEEDFRWGFDRFIDEARHLLRISHTNIVEVERFLEANGTAYIVMEYVEGRTLADDLETSGPMDQAQLLEILLPILDGLERIHETGLLHRDIKPSNIVLRAPDDPVLIDFGAARFATSRHSRRMTRIVTTGFSPHEQYADEGRQGPWTDIYALAAVCYTCLTGRRPADCNSRLGTDPVRPLVDVVPDGNSRSFLEAVDWGMSVFDSDRPRDIASWRRALLEQEEAPPRARSATGDEETPGPSLDSTNQGASAPRRWLIGSALLILIAVLAAVSFPQVRREALAAVGLLELNELDLVVSPDTATVRIVGEGYDERWEPGKRFPAGEYDLQALAPFFHAENARLTLPLEEREAIELDRKQFPLTVRTVPEDARVEIIETGQTVVDGQPVEAGNWTIRARAGFYRDRTVPVRLDEPTEIEIALEPARHELTIHVVPQEAAGTVRLTEPEVEYRPGMELRAGPVAAEIVADGYESQQRRFTLDEDTVIEVALDCELSMVTQQRCEQRTRTEYRTESVDRSERMSEYASYTGPWTMPAPRVCNEAERRARRDLRDGCEERGYLASLSDSDEECAWRRDCEVYDRRGNAMYFEERYRCEAEAHGRCEWSEDRRMPEEVPYEHCEEVEMPRRVCPDDSDAV